MVVGVADDDALNYWFSGPAIVMLWNGLQNSLDRRLKGLEDHGIIYLLFRLPPTVSQRALQDLLRKTLMRDGYPLVVGSIPAFLFPERLRAAARTAGISAAVGLCLGVVGALMLLLLDVALCLPELHIRHLLGATPASYFRTTLLRDLGRNAVAVAPVIACAVTLALACSPTQPSVPVTLKIALPVACLVAVVFSLTAVSLRAGWLRLLGRRTSVFNRPWSVRPAIRLVLLVQACGAMLLICALAYREAYTSLVSVPLGMSLDSVIVAELQSAVMADRRSLSDATARLIDSLRPISGVRCASVTLSNPVADQGFTATVAIEGVGQFLNGRSRDGRRVITPGRNVVGPGFVTCVGGRVIGGRDITWEDTSSARRVVLVNETMARTYWHGESPLGRRLKFRPTNDFSEEWAEVVGVVSDIQHEGYRGKVKPEAYLSILRENRVSNVMFVVVEGPKIRKQSTVAQAAVSGAVLTFRLRRMFSLREEGQAAVGTLRVAANFLIVTAGLGFVSQWFAALLGAISYAESHRRDLGVRMALGARLAGLVGPMVRAFAAAGVTAILLGITSGYGLTRSLATFDPDLGGVTYTRGFVLSILAITSSLLVSGVFVARTWRKRSPIELLREL